MPERRSAAGLKRAQTSQLSGSAWQRMLPPQTQPRRPIPRVHLPLGCLTALTHSLPSFASRSSPLSSDLPTLFWHALPEATVARLAAGSDILATTRRLATPKRDLLPRLLAAFVNKQPISELSGLSRSWIYVTPSPEKSS